MSQPTVGRPRAGAAREQASIRRRAVSSGRAVGHGWGGRLVALWVLVMLVGLGPSVAPVQAQATGTTAPPAGPTATRAPGPTAAQTPSVPSPTAPPAVTPPPATPPPATPPPATPPPATP